MMNRAFVVAILVVVAALSLLQAQTPPPGAAGQSGTPGLLSQTYWNDVPTVTEVATHDGVGEGVKAFGKVCLEEAAVLEKTGERVLDAAGKPGLGGAMREKGLKLFGEAKQAEKLNRLGATWAQKLGRTLDRINIANTVARTLGHAVEGDLPGAVGAVADEVTKKVTTAGMAAAGGVGGPLGSFAGAMAGEELHDRYTRPAIEKKADEWRLARAREQLLGSAAQTPPDQRETARGEEQRLKDAVERAERKEGAQPETVAEGGGDILGQVSPVRLRATGRNAIRNVVTSALTLSFYNVGSLVPGHGKAVLSITSTDSFTNTPSTSTCQGLFSGGPGGSFRMLCDRTLVHLRLVNGEHIVAPDGVRLTLDNPAAFKDWPVKP